MVYQSMRFFAVVAFVGIILSGSSTKATDDLNQSQRVTVSNSLATMPLAFTQNNGQWPDSILYRADAGGATMWFTPNGAFYQFIRRVPSADSSSTEPDAMAHRMRLPSRGLARDSVETMMIKASFVGCNPKPQLAGDNLLEYKCNYFLGNDQSKWRTDVPNYTSVTYKEVYPGIDLKYYGDGRQMEYDFIVPPGADYSQIKIQYEGAKSLAVTGNGDLVVETAWGTVTEKAPVVYQMDGANRTAITGSYRVADNHSFGFALGAGYNRLLPVVIDPVLSYSTYLGGGGAMAEEGWGIAVDGAGSAYVIGRTYSSDFPTAVPFDGSLNYYDAYVTKLSPNGSSLVYSTYLGGSSSELGYGIAVDRAGSAYVTGWTYSSDFPTATPFDGTLNGYYDAFVTKLSPAGNSLIYSTYLGGSSGDDGYGIVVDGAESAYVTGETSSSDFPTITPFDASFAGTFFDAYVTKLSPTGNSLVYSTYLGGGGHDLGYGIAVDGAGSAYVVGRTQSADFPTVTPYDDTFNGGTYDVYVTKLSPAGNSLAYSTYLGGSSDEEIWGVVLDGTGSAYVAGTTKSGDFPTVTPFAGSLNGLSDAYVTKLSPDGSSLAYSTYLGGSGSEEGYGIAVDGAGSAYVTGYTQSADFPTVTPFDGSFNGGTYDAYVTELSPAGNSLVYSSYFGGSGDDEGYAIAVDGSGSTYVTGWTTSADFPTATPFDGSFNGGVYDAFVTKVTPSDRDNDGVPDGIDNCPDVYNPDQTDTDGDALGDACDPDDDNDGVLDAADTNPLDPDVCADADADGCDDCAVGTDDFGPLADNLPANDGLDTDGDGLCNTGDPDDDNDGVLDAADTNPLNPDVCADVDADGCDDCTVGTDGFGPLPDNLPANDGIDTDGDGLCDAGDVCPTDPSNDVDHDGVCGNIDNCPTVQNPDQIDTDGDTQGDACDPDDDNDGVADGADSSPLNPDVCADADADGCDDCAVGTDNFGPLTDNFPANDGIDADGDGLCNTGDMDDDNDGVLDGADTNPLNPDVCADADADGCDDCAVGTDNFGPLADNFPANDGIDTDADGKCDAGDVCPSDPLNDVDHDSVCGNVDNCPTVANPLQTDSNHDGIGDACCCLNRTGNVDCDPLDKADISDLTALVDNLYLSLAPLCCAAEANVNGSIDGKADISDLTALVDYLYLSFTSPAACQ